MSPDLIRLALGWLTEPCLCGWPVTPEIEFRASRLFAEWECPVCSAEWDHYERVPAT